ncbi:hypothetical protein [Thermus albus]|uniref:hypothetical protein n=1 Tax=Thermus albus TaxID=2908146 RepID=UPI001FAA7EFF|nr:hypothetical protein [Thermus albus]
MVTRKQAKRLSLPLEGRLHRRIEVAAERGKGKNRILLDLYLDPSLEGYPASALYHLVLSVQGVLLLSPTAWEIPLAGGVSIPDAFLLFPWGTAYLEVDTGHYARETVKEKLRLFRKADRVYWASPNRSRLDWAQDLAATYGTPLVPLWLPPLE